ncbi:MAG: VWA domain-containing protein [Deltaproteobacteria bacterium]|nr:VWA domain-containing protein [Deltaproteobacteria bacterium]
MRFSLLLGGLLATVAIAAASCGSDGDGSALGTGGAGGSGGSAQGGSGGEGGAGIGTCDPECGAGQYCSVTGTCIDDGTCAADGDCGEGLECDPATHTCVPGGGCGAVEVTIDPVPPNLMIVLDRSCSMRRDLNNNLVPQGPNKWTFSVDAINQMTVAFQTKIRFGLILFPDTSGGNCGQDQPAVPVGPNNEATIQSLLTAALNQNDPNFPDGPCVTNIDTAMQQASQEPAFLDTTRDSYALLITDGKQAGCSAAGGDAGTTQIITDMDAANVSTFVVGFGGAVDPAQLDIWAQAGGVAQATSPYYYQADSATQLQQALDVIANQTLGCVFQLQETPPDPDAIFVFFNNDPQPIPRDVTHQNGWDYDPQTNQIEFFGSYCDDLKDGNVTDVDIVFGCPEPTPD